MVAPSIHGVSIPYSATNAVEAIARALGEIKAQDKLTFADIGAVLGKSEDSAAHYIAGSATMDAVTFGRGKREWGSRFTGYFDRLCDDSRPGRGNDRECEASVLRAALALSVALSDDNTVSAQEIRANRQTIEAARDALDGLLAKVRVAA